MTGTVVIAWQCPCAGYLTVCCLPSRVPQPACAVYSIPPACLITCCIRVHGLNIGNCTSSRGSRATPSNSWYDFDTVSELHTTEQVWSADHYRWTFNQLCSHIFNVSSRLPIGERTRSLKILIPWGEVCSEFCVLLVILRKHAAMRAGGEKKANGRSVDGQPLHQLCSLEPCIATNISDSAYINKYTAAPLRWSSG